MPGFLRTVLLRVLCLMLHTALAVSVRALAGPAAPCPTAEEASIGRKRHMHSPNTAAGPFSMFVVFDYCR